MEARTKKEARKENDDGQREIRMREKKEERRTDRGRVLHFLLDSLTRSGKATA
jgi:hypothetical protein